MLVSVINIDKILFKLCQIFIVHRDANDNTINHACRVKSYFTLESVNVIQDISE